MNKAFYIIGIVLAVVFILLGAYYASEVQSAKWASYFDSLSSDYSYGYSYYNNYEYKDLTTEAAIISSLFFIFYIAMDLLGLLMVKTGTTKVLSIIGLSLTGIFTLWNIVVMFSDGGITYDEVFPAYMMYCLVMLAFGIVGLVQSVRYAKRGSVVPTSNLSANKDLLDS